jgi:hypothetical protein
LQSRWKRKRSIIKKNGRKPSKSINSFGTIPTRKLGKPFAKLYFRASEHQKYFNFRNGGSHRFCQKLCSKLHCAEWRWRWWKIQSGKESIPPRLNVRCPSGGDGEIWVWIVWRW